MEHGKWTTGSNKDEITCSRECSIIGEIYSVTVGKLAYEAWKDGVFAQDAFPELNAEEREFLISGTTPAEWDDMFKNMDD